MSENTVSTLDVCEGVISWSSEQWRQSCRITSTDSIHHGIAQISNTNETRTIVYFVGLNQNQYALGLPRDLHEIRRNKLVEYTVLAGKERPILRVDVITTYVVWPDSVMVFEWFFKTTNIDNRQAAIGKRQCLDEPTTVDATLTSDQRQQTDMDLSSNDDTILTGSTSTTLVNTDTQDG